MTRSTGKDWKGKDRLSTDVVMKSKDAKESDIIIPIMGPSGVGKSTFINTAVGDSVTRVGHGLESCTTDLQHVIIPYPDDTSRRVIFLDTPSFDGTYSDDSEILRRIGVWLAQSYHDNMKVAGIIYLHELYHAPAASRRNLMVLRKLCGEDAMKNVILTTTKWGDPSDEIAQKSMHDQLATSWKDMIDQGCRTAQFRNTRESAWEIVNLIAPRSPLALQIQTELVDLAKRIPETEAGKSLRNIVMELVNGNGDQSNDAVQQRLKATEKEIRSVLKDIQKLRVPLSKRILAFFGFRSGNN
ncbi:hypothetical protein BV22DRAFT_1033458 [Leucogyrophana mollusca]|uniref:Uncharacterized protein n=1 Tax=Leucogyrophana mollusca TaxID=85980 RepID=A0ACB8BKC6_9AGAM|nr:hypothetical protein BV22DRAFT_1033458 [Leucogyrophana mollusca]